MQKNLNRQYFIIVLVLSLAIGVTMHFPNVINYFFGEVDTGRGGRGHDERFIMSFTHLGLELLITYIVAILMFTLNFFILKPVEKHRKLKPLSIVLAIVLTVISVYILNHLLFSLKNLIEPPSPRRGPPRNEFDLTNFFVSAMVVGCVLIIRLIFQKQTIHLENEALRREALQSQFESLKNQLSPHFLFNSLTTLKILIQEAPDKAQDFVNSLSRALRYTLQSNEEQLVTLEKEMEFMESYLFLIRMRFSTNLQVVTKVSETLLGYRLPPLTIQTLVENAIKHNEISKRKPLKIQIVTTGTETLVIENEIQVKRTGEEGTGIGLTNLAKQFQLLAGKEIMVRKENNLFTVEIPLIRP